MLLIGENILIDSIRKNRTEQELRLKLNLIFSRAKITYNSNKDSKSIYFYNYTNHFSKNRGYKVLLV